MEGCRPTAWPAYSCPCRVGQSRSGCGRRPRQSPRPASPFPAPSPPANRRRWLEPLRTMIGYPRVQAGEARCRPETRPPHAGFSPGSLPAPPPRRLPVRYLRVRAILVVLRRELSAQWAARLLPGVFDRSTPVLLPAHTAPRIRSKPVHWLSTTPARWPNQSLALPCADRPEQD